MTGLPTKLPKTQDTPCPCLICISAKANHPSRNLDTNHINVILSALIHLDFVLYNTQSIRGFASSLNIIDTDTHKLWTFPTTDKRPPIIHANFFINYLEKIKCPCHEVRVDEGGELARSMEFTNFLLTHHFNLQTTGGHSSWINGRMERSHQTTTKMTRAALRDSDQDDNKWCFASEATAETYNSIRHFTTQEQPHFAWYNVRTDINHLRVWGCEIFPLAHHPSQLDDRVQ